MEKRHFSIGHSDTQSALQYRLTFTHSCTQSHTDDKSTTHGDGQLVREQSGFRCLVLGHLDILTLGGAGDRTGNLPVTSRPALPPQPHAAPPPTSPGLGSSRITRYGVRRCRRHRLTPSRCLYMCVGGEITRRRLLPECVIGS